VDVCVCSPFVFDAPCNSNCQQAKAYLFPVSELICSTKKLHNDNNKITKTTTVCPGFVQTLNVFSRTFQDLHRPNSRVFQDSKILFSGLSRTRSIHKHGLHEVKKEHIQNHL